MDLFNIIFYGCIDLFIVLPFFVFCVITFIQNKIKKINLYKTIVMCQGNRNILIKELGINFYNQNWFTINDMICFYEETGREEL